MLIHIPDVLEPLSNMTDATTDTNGFFQLVYDPDSYTFYIMGYEVIRIDYANNIYYVRHW